MTREGRMSESAKINQKIKHLTGIEGEYRTIIKRAQEDIRRDPDRRKKYERVVKKYEGKISKILPKVRRLRELRARRA